jgi:hypothetical protein
MNFEECVVKEKPYVSPAAQIVEEAKHLSSMITVLADDINANLAPIMVVVDDDPDAAVVKCEVPEPFPQYFDCLRTIFTEIRNEIVRIMDMNNRINF